MVRQPPADQLRTTLGERVTQLLAPTRQERRHYLNCDSVCTVQDAIVDVAKRLKRPGWSAYLVGGTLRDLLINARNRSFEPRDVDIIVRGATRDELRDCLQESLSLERLTRFGGLHLSRTLSSGSRVVFDIWTLTDTWGFHSQKIVPRIEDFPGTTFLNIDSCAIEVQEPLRRGRALFEKGFFAGIANRVLDVNYAPNPYPYVCIARALLLAAQLEFTIARSLAQFVLDHTATGGVEALIVAQLSHYGTVHCDAAGLKTWLHEIQHQFECGEHAIHIDILRAEHLKP
jgi:hypothetical protein